MAVVGYQEVTRGTAIVLGQSGALNVTVPMNVSGMANDTAWSSALIDLGATHADEYEVSLHVGVGTSPWAGGTYDVYLPCSLTPSGFPYAIGTTVPGTPENVAFTLGTSDVNLRSCGNIVNQLVCIATGSVTQRASNVIWRPAGRYVVAILDNNSGQSMALNTDTRIILTPRRSVFNDQT